MDLHLHDAPPTDDERAAIDGLLGAPASPWEGGERSDPASVRVSLDGRRQRDRRHLLLPALRALQARVGWISESGLNYVCARLGVPPADAWGVATFYALLSTTPRAKRVVHVCDDVACRCRGAQQLIAELERTIGPAHEHGPDGDHVVLDDKSAVWMRSPCLGMCEHAPAAFVQQFGAHADERLIPGLTAKQARDLLKSVVPPAPPTSESSPRLAGGNIVPQQGDPSLELLKRVGVVDPSSVEAYERSGGFTALRRAIEIGPRAVIEQVIASGLTGRGGAAFPTGRKWEAVANQSARPHYLVCNADESEPGTFKDRVLMEGDPFAVVESIAIAALATGCEKAFIYIRGEYPLARARLQHAIDESRRRGHIGRELFAHGVPIDIEIRSGAGAYICGEETAIFNSIEGFRGEPRNKPPFPVQAGLFGMPTVVNNVETLVNVPRIVLQGGAAFASTGSGQSTGTKLFCVSGNVARPGVYEVPFGTTLRRVIDMAGGVAGGRKLQAVMLGGAAGVFVSSKELDIVLTLEGARAAKATLGSGVIVLFDDTVDMADIVLRIAAFFRDESCGQCVPCRVGTVRQEEALHRIVAGRTFGGVRQELALLAEVGGAMRDSSICGLGQTAYAAVESAIERLGLFTADAPGART